MKNIKLNWKRRIIIFVVNCKQKWILIARMKDELINWSEIIPDVSKKFREIERLENASEEEILELKSEISTLKSHLYQARKDVRDKDKYISSLEKQIIESEKQVEKLRC